MITIAAALLDRAEAGTAPTRDDFDQIPQHQVETYFAELSVLCPDRIEMPTPRRPGNALNIEVGAPTPRCAQKSPDGRGAAWLASGGSPLAYGNCCASGCPRALAVTARVREGE